MLFGVYGFVNGEQTAITTVPAQIATVPIFVPQTPTPLPPTPTAVPSATAGPKAEPGTSAAGPVTWVEVGPVLVSRCGACHNATALISGLSFDTYADAMKGGTDGAVIVAGDAANSLLFQVQADGGHPGQLTPEELALVQAWIDAGAAER
jgi:mono/diheme cytochrome c family protein